MLGGFRFRHCLAALAAAFAAPVLAADPPPLEAYGELPAVELMTLSPSGERIAALTTVKGKRMLLALDANMDLLRMYEAGDTKVRDIRWLGNDAVLIVLSQTQDLPVGYVAEQSEAWSAVIMPIEKTKDIQVVFGKQANVLDRIFGDYGQRLVGGEWRAYFSGTEQSTRAAPRSGHFGAYSDVKGITLFKVDPADGRGTAITKPDAGENNVHWLIGPDGRVAATFVQNYNSGRWEIRNAGGKLLTSGKDPEGDAGLITLGKNGDTLIFTQQDPEDSAQDWFEMPLDGSAQPVEVYADEDIESLFVDRASGLMIGYLLQGANPKPVLFDPKQQAAVEAVMSVFSKFDVTLVDWSMDFSKILVHTSGNANSGTWYLVDLGKKNAQDIGSDYPRVRPDKVGQISTVEYTAADGLEMDGILTLPPDREPRNLPVILLPHGGPTAQDDAKFDWWAQAFASRGYAVFQPNFRGSTNRDESFLRAGYGEWGRKMQTDISDGLAELVKRGIADPRRACIVGHSYGGYAALAGVTLQQGLYRCAVSVAGVSDLELRFLDAYQETGRNKMVKRAFVEARGPRDSYKSISPRRFATKADAPILLIHGKNDTVVNFEQSEKMAAALKDAGKPFEMVVLEKEDHWLSRAETRKQMLEAAMAFVQKHNPAD